MATEQATTSSLTNSSKPKTTIAGLLFDLDGTLVDSENRCFTNNQEIVSYIDACAGREDGTPHEPLVYDMASHHHNLGAGPGVWQLNLFDLLGIWYEGPPPAPNRPMSEEERLKYFSDRTAKKETHPKWVWKKPVPIPAQYVMDSTKPLPLPGTSVTAEDLTAISDALAHKNGLIPMMPGVQEFFTTLAQHPTLSKVPWAIATSSRRTPAERKISVLQGDDFSPQSFKAIVCSTDEEVAGRAKPEPDIYLIAREKVRAWRRTELKGDDEKDEQEEGLWVAFEDSPTGVKSGHAAGLFVIALHDKLFNDGTNPWMGLANATFTGQTADSRSIILQTLPLLESLHCPSD